MSCTSCGRSVMVVRFVLNFILFPARIFYLVIVVAVGLGLGIASIRVREGVRETRTRCRDKTAGP